MDAENLDIDKILQSLTLEDKLNMLSGDGMWHTRGIGDLPRVRMSDGPNGVRMEHGTGTVPATCFPTSSMLANSWSPDLLYRVGEAIAQEATALGVNLLLAPGLNIKRHPLGGRNFEYFSEDPYLSGTLGKAYVSGVQSTGVGACIKHFAANSQEYRRNYSDSVIDPRALHELYLRPFEIALEAEPVAVMSAYNKLNGEYCSQSEYLLKTVLRDELGFKGVTVSDWGAVHNRAQALEAGLDLEMPDSLGLSANELAIALENGEIDEATVDKSVRRILVLIDNVYLQPYGDIDADEHDKLAYSAAAESLVMLKNDSLLPLTKDMRVAVVGSYAECAPVQGEGSSHVTPLRSVSALEAFEKRAINITYFKGYNSDGSDDAELFDRALTGCKGADAVIVFAGVPAPSEGADRKNMLLPSVQNKLISALADSGHKVAVVLTVPGPVEMPWVDKVRAVIYGGLLGQSGALAEVDALYGRINPRGRLAETFPIDCAGLGKDFGKERTLYRESIFVGYKYYEKTNRRVLFPFGHGLSFSNVTYDAIRLQRTATDEFVVSVTLTNRSARDCYETVQLYVADKTGRVMTPEKQLAAYSKVFVEGETSATVVLHIDKSAFSFFNAAKNCKSVSNGEHKIIVAASATDVKGELSVMLDGTYGDYDDIPEHYVVPFRTSITDDDFASLFPCGTLPEETRKPKKGEYTIDCCLDDIKDSFVAKMFLRSVAKRAKELGLGTPASDAYIANVTHTPLYAVAAMSGGALSVGTALGMVEMANGHFFGGLKTMIKQRFGKK